MQSQLDIQDKLAKQKKKIGSTPLYELFLPGDFPNGNRVFAKAEFINPSGSHYDRIYLKLFEKEQEQLAKADYAVEVSSGNAGASFAWFCKQVGLKCKVILPEGLPRGFGGNIRRLNPAAQITFSDQDYLKGAVRQLREELAQGKKSGKNIYCPNHSRKEE